MPKKSHVEMTNLSLREIEAAAPAGSQCGGEDERAGVDTFTRDLTTTTPFRSRLKPSHIRLDEAVSADWVSTKERKLVFPTGGRS